MRRQLDDVRSGKGARGGGVMLVPPIIMSLDAWEQLAAASQDALIRASEEDRQIREPVVVIRAPSVDSNAESERIYQEYRRAALLGGLDYIRHKEELVRQATAGKK